MLSFALFGSPGTTKRSWLKPSNVPSKFEHCCISNEKKVWQNRTKPGQPWDGDDVPTPIDSDNDDVDGCDDDDGGGGFDGCDDTFFNEPSVVAVLRLLTQSSASASGCRS